jgi:glutamate formiminotransferase/formiminotetrahydrofolate cyclodeaminase
MEVSQAMADIGMPASVSDAGVGVMCARTGAMAAYLNVRTNFKGFNDAAFQKEVMDEAEALKTKAEEIEDEVMRATLAKI